ncbi:HK97 family phage prohead protease [Gaoshiqia sediminis]|uniref:HK97 family phage prohead protease n=1 Tax=Gaoshiqia sediminis TaxID=2986998 RepID=A0AA41YBG0_9BACT|nr:HK97 family phage prohead protease [Gaoshiqia sediminis]MCW0484663.1 HK97 family phage prohead protease [Gaoshiqia sediminis]
MDGYASVFNQRSKLMLEKGKVFFEIIKPGAFDEVLQKEDLNVKAVVDHNPEKLLGRTKSGTLLLSVDDKGLKYSILMGNTQLHKDTLEMVERGDLYESSFIFSIKPGDSTFTRDENGNLLHIVNKISGLYDVTLATDGAYANTDVSIRKAISDYELEEAKEKLKLIQEENNNKRNYIIELKNSL